VGTTMKKSMFAAVSAAFAISAVAAESDKVLSIDHITFAGVQYDLPTTQKSDGTVCVSYLSKTHHEGGKSVAAVAEHCERKGERQLVPPPVALNEERGSSVLR
jgi:hypothetical protein